MKTIDLRKIIADKLDFYKLNSFFGFNVGEFGMYSYKINYQTSSNLFNEHERTHVVEFDVFSNDDVEVEKIADKIETLFNYQTYDSATFYLESRSSSDEKNVYRRILRYEVRTFGE